jgi:MFS family permease
MSSERPDGPASSSGGSPDPPVTPSLWTADFVFFLVSQSAVTLGTQLQAAVVGYQLYALTRDPLSLGAIGLAEALPFISLAPLGGHVADTIDRRRIALVGFAVMVLVAAALLALTTSGGALGPGPLRLGIYAAVVASGVARSFLQPARLALSAQIVPRLFYARAIAWRTGLFQLSAVLGPALGGLLYGWAGGAAAYLVALLLFVAASAAMAMVHSPPLTEPRSSAPFFTSVRQGVAVLFHEPVLLPALVLDLFAVLFGGATALLPVFAEEILRVGPRGFGVLRAAPAVGALLASAVIAVRPPFRRAGRTLLLAVAGFGLCMIAFALSRSFELSLLLLAASGALDMVSVLVRSTLLQLRVPGPFLGRVASLNQIFIGSSNEIGAFESGMAAHLLGTVPSVVMGGAITLAVVAVVARTAPALRRLGSLGA